MSRTQLGLRLPDDEAAELRAAARERRMTLGELVMTLLRESRAKAGRGLWVELEEGQSHALDAVAAASEATREEVLRGLASVWLSTELGYLQRWLQEDLDRQPPRLAAALAGEITPPAPDRRGAAQRAASPAPAPASADADEPTDEPPGSVFTLRED